MSKRLDYISWDKYFMELAILSSRRSKDPSTQVGAVIIGSDNKIVSIGYNGMPRGCSDNIFNWGKENKEDNKYLYVVHAEVNAVLNANVSVEGCKMYTTLFPCNECAKIIIQSGIKEIIYGDKKKGISYEASKRMFNASGLKYKIFVD